MPNEKNPRAYAMRGVQVPGETLQEVSAQWKTLDDEGKADMIGYAETEIALAAEVEVVDAA